MPPQATRRALWLAGAGVLAVTAARTPNVIVMFADDFGWGDVSCNTYKLPDGSVGTTAETPNIDRLAASGMRFTDMHVGASVCTPSRAALMTGRYGARTGVYQNFWPNSLYGLPVEEKTIAELLKPNGYDTAMIGKWHLGTQYPYHPTYRGFEHYFGIPYSVDMGCTDTPGANLPPDSPCPTDPPTPTAPTAAAPRRDSSASARNAFVAAPVTVQPLADDYVALPLYNSTTNCSFTNSCNPSIIQQPLVLSSVTEEYSKFAHDYILNHASDAAAPFFLYIAFAHTHVPLAHAPKWTNASKAKTIFADTVLELDDAVGNIWRAVQEAGLVNDTLILATSDNGPWQVKCNFTGTPGPYVGAYQAELGGGGTMKFTTWEGGHRTFGVAAWPGRIPANTTSHALVSTLDFLPTILSLAGVPLPTDRQYDGVDLAPVLFHHANSTRTVLFHPDTTGNLTAFRYNDYKLYWETNSEESCTEPAGPTLSHNPPLVFNVKDDPSESTPIKVDAPTLQAAVSMWKSQMNNMSTTFRSVANYTSGNFTNSPCCNPKHVLCRCEN